VTTSVVATLKIMNAPLPDSFKQSAVSADSLNAHGGVTKRTESSERAAKECSGGWCSDAKYRRPKWTDSDGVKIHLYGS